MKKARALLHDGFRKGDLLELKIERLSIGGRGVARHGGLVVFVPDTAPEDAVEAELTFIKKNYAEARMVRLIEPSSHRVQPPCPVAGVCGGCSWQHISYEEQLRQKQMLVHDALKKFAPLLFTTAPSVKPTVPSPKQFQYRNRIQLHYAQTTTKGLLLGFHKRSSHQIVDINDCPITEDILTNEFLPLRRQLTKRFAEGAGVALKNEARTGRIELFIKSEDAGGQPASHDLVGMRNEDTKLARQGEDTPFAQVNTAQNSQLIAYVVQTFERLLLSPPYHPSFDTDSLRIFDLYCGNGNFTLPLARAFSNSTVIGVELNKENVRVGKSRAEREFVSSEKRVHFLDRDVVEFLNNEAGTPPLESSTEPNKSLSSEQKNLVVLLDPPRAGCAPEVMVALLALRPKLIVYVSCHPVTLARDLSLLGSEFYELLEAQPFDMFPQTDHVETVAVLSQRSS